MSSWLDKVREAVLVDPSKGLNGAAGNENKSNREEMSGTNHPSDIQQAQGSNVENMPESEFVQKYVARLTDAVNGKKTLYSELHELMVSTAAVLPDEELRMKAAFAVLKVREHTVQDLLDAIDEQQVYIADVQRSALSTASSETATFLSTLEKQKTSLEAAITHHQQAIESIKQEAERRIAEEQEAMGQKTGQLAEVEHGLSNTRTNMERATKAIAQASDTFTSELGALRRKIALFLGS